MVNVYFASLVRRSHRRKTGTIRFWDPKICIVLPLFSPNAGVNRIIFYGPYRREPYVFYGQRIPEPLIMVRFGRSGL